LETIEKVASDSAKSVALRQGQLEITYGALIAAADQLADNMAQQGAGPGKTVAVCLDRSIAAIVAILGVLRAGAAYLPLDPAWPVDRLRHILDDAGACTVVAGPPLDEALGAPGRSTIGAPGPARPRRPPRRPPTPAPDSLAYVIYTSGSTGAPKGVEVTHANLAALVSWHLAAFDLTGEDRGAWIAGLGFDASVWEIFPNLAAGATVCIPHDETRASAVGLRRWLADEGVTVAFAPTPLAELMVRAEWPADARLRLLLTGGDALHVRPRPDAPFRLVNNYGPTECTVVATSGVVQATCAGLPTLGAPLPGSRIEIVGEGGEPVGPGETGEIWIAGPHVARGYRGRADLTAERFVTASPGGGPLRRFYRTGDLGSWTADGEIAFHGREDDQIKHRGHRIEPDEISAALSRHPSVGQCATATDGTGAEKRLVAYVTPADARIPRAGELRSFLADRVPHFMLPEVFVRLAELPLTASGKVDRSALPPPTPANALPTAAYRAPSTPVETRIAELVETLLEVRGVGLDDNFFLLGGHSLLGSQLVLRIRDLFGAELTLRDLFEAQSIQSLAAKVERSVEAMVAAMSEDELAERLAGAGVA
jgi:amino acid adenylation domain-containing protein